MKNSVRIWCPASVANINVGFDALGFCLSDAGDEIIAERVDSPGIHLGELKGFPTPDKPEENVAYVAANSVYRAAKESNIGIRINIDKRIKPGSGVGSSAASAVGAAFAANELLGRPFTKEELLPFCIDGEAIASKTRHADNIAPALLGGFCLVVTQEDHLAVSLETDLDLHYVVAHQQIEIKTSASRTVIPQDIPLETAIKQWSNLGGFTAALFKNDKDLLAYCAKDFVVETHRKSQIPHFDELRELAVANGALIFGISGSGPSVFALCESNQNAMAVRESFDQLLTKKEHAYHLYSGSVDKKGVHELL